MTDAGMTGDYDSVIGMDKEEPLRRFTRKTPGGRFEPAHGEATLCGVAVEIGADGLANMIAPVRLGGRLGRSGRELGAVCVICASTLPWPRPLNRRIGVSAPPGGGARR